MRRLLPSLALAASGMLFAQPPNTATDRMPPAPPPHLVMERLTQMTPEQRERMLSRLPADRRAMVEERLEKYKLLPEAVKTRLRDEYNQFLQLSPRQQDEARSLYRKFTEMPEDRRKLVRRELHRLRNFPERRRTARMQSEQFKTEYSEQERNLLTSLIAILEPPKTDHAVE